MKIIGIGSSPSSGSTLLADLLDSVPGGICGPELQLFSFRELFTNYPDFVNDPFSHRSAPAPYLKKGVLINAHNLHYFGLDRGKLAALASASCGANAFVQNVARHYARFRNTDAAFFAEKTPANIYGAKWFLDTIEDSYFIQIVRHPYFAIRSIVRRGFPIYIAAATWLLNVAHGYVLRTHPRFRSITYEELVSDPFARIAALCAECGHSTTAEEVQEGYIYNEYRKANAKRLETWSVKSAAEVTSANRDFDSRSLNRFLYELRNVRINRRYGELYGLEDVSFSEVFSYYYREKLPSSGTKAADLEKEMRIWSDFTSRDMLKMKWRRDVKRKFVPRKCRGGFLRPILISKSRQYDFARSKFSRLLPRSEA